MTEKNKMRTVEMFQAFRWFCMDCGTENFDRGVEMDLTEEEEEELRFSMGIDPLDKGAFIRISRTVTCRECLMMFNTSD